MEQTLTITDPTVAHRILWLLAVVTAEYLLVLAAALGDMASGIRKARRSGQATRSRALRRTVDKLARYYNVLAVLTVVDAMQITAALYLRCVEGFDVPTLALFTLAGSLGMACIEVKSIFEKGSEKEKSDLAELTELAEQLADSDKTRALLSLLRRLKDN